MIRKFDTGATRDTSNGKLEYEGYINPLNDYSFAEYMKTKQIIGGEYRKGDNRQKGIPTDAIFPSLIRHVEILKLLYKGYDVYEYNNNDEVKLYVGNNPPLDSEKKNIVQELNAIRFNSEAMKLNYLLGNNKTTDDGDIVMPYENIDENFYQLYNGLGHYIGGFNKLGKLSYDVIGSGGHAVTKEYSVNYFGNRLSDGTPIYTNWYKDGTTVNFVPMCLIKEEWKKDLSGSTGIIEGLFDYDVQRVINNLCI